LIQLKFEKDVVYPKGLFHVINGCWSKAKSAIYNSIFLYCKQKMPVGPKIRFYLEESSFFKKDFLFGLKFNPIKLFCAKVVWYCLLIVGNE